MKKILQNKKILLLLTLLLLLIFFSTYIKTSELKLDEIYQIADPTEKELLFKAEESAAEEEKTAEITNKSAEKKPKKTAGNSKESQAETAISKIALISEIKDPFKSNLDTSSEQTAAAGEDKREQKINSKDDYPTELLDLEQNITARNLIKGTVGAKKQQAEFSDSELKNQKKDGASSIAVERKIDLEKVKLPFKLLGIIKNDTNSSVLFQYQGQTVVKNKKDRIGQFIIKEINNKEIIISYQKAEKTIRLWEDGKNEK